MSATVDYTFYTTVYMGSEADEASFPALSARAADVVGAMIRWRDPETLADPVLTLYKKAVCAQVDYFALNGFESVAGGRDRGFTVGKVSVHGRSGASASGSMSGNIAPMAQMYLEQSGLLNPAVPVAPDIPMIGWWF